MSPEPTFEKLVAPHRAELRLHCYRMLGSSHDGDDMVQETLVRAWRAKDSLDDPRAARSWLYRIATNVCLDELARRPKREMPARLQELPDPSAVPAPTGEEWWIEPCPGAWLDGAAPHDPATKIELKESIALAFVVALQVLTPPQRAVLLLRDVVGFSAEETARALGITTSAANSALHRARTAVDGRNPAPPEPVDADLLGRYVRAWEAADADALVHLLSEELTAVMPPIPACFGRGAFEAYFRHRIQPRLRREGARLVRCDDANGHPAFGFYFGETLAAVQVVRAHAGRIVGIDQFFVPKLFSLFGLAPNVPAHRTT